MLLAACAAPVSSPAQPTGIRFTQTPDAEPTSRTSQSAIRNLQQAAYNYAHYHALTPDDLLGLKRLAEACAALEGAGGEDELCRMTAEKVMGEQGSTGQGESRNSPAALLWTEWLDRVACAEPNYPVGQELDNGWTLLGYDVDEDRLVRGAPVDLLLYWVGPASAKAGSEQDGWYRAGERWVHVLQGVQNLVLNGGFELGIEENESPAGFPGDIYRADPDTRRLVTGLRAGRRTTVALLDNTQVYNRTSFTSAWVPVNPDGLYLQAGWVKSTGGNGYLGRRWAGDIAQGVRRYSYAAAGVKADDWHHYAGLSHPLAGATSCQMWLLNYKAVGQVYFDDVLFVEVGLPGK